MKQFKLVNTLLGWCVFIIAAIVYLLTVEPAVSFWDCPEFITTAYKFEIGHPPGYPFFSLVGHLFSLFASDPSHVGAWINRFSVINSAGTVLFLFWTITLLARTLLVKKDEDMTTSKMISILGAGLVGALAFAFTDSFWFSATETDVFSFSGLCTSFGIWAMLKWSEVADRSHADRWVILIAYVVGISIGVHLLNLLTIPAMVMIYYYRMHTHSRRNALIAVAMAIGILASIFFGIMPSFFWLSSYLELFFVNTLSLPFNTGVFAYALITFGILAWAIYETYKGKNDIRTRVAFILGITLSGAPFLTKSIWLGLIVIGLMVYFLLIKKVTINRRVMNLITVCITMLLIGYSQYAVVLIRSSAQPPMDENSPDNVFSLMSYLNREQYGDVHPLFYGPAYTADYKWKSNGNGGCVPDQKTGSAIWGKKPKDKASDKDEYVITGYKESPVYDDAFCMFFPRMYSNQPSHVSVYKEWTGEPGETVDYTPCGQQSSGKRPTFLQNIQFFLGYQVNFMYLRYFFWNFSGRQNDMQATRGEIDRGNWITGIPFIDNILVGDQSNVPPDMLQNKGRNTYFMLPFLLGMIGFFFLLLYAGKRGKEIFWIVCTLFLLTGLAIVIYLNQSPVQPRERDYSYCGSFYAFCIWIGFGVLALTELLRKKLNHRMSAIIATILGLGIPTILIAQNWDDHDRSDRYTCRDFGANYLNSLAPNAIIFTNGDNDTFPLWYSIEVEGLRPDVRVCNLSYLQTDWYIDQMKRKAYKSEPLPISWSPDQYAADKHEAAYVYDPKDSTKLELGLALDFVRSTDPRTKDPMGNDIFPSTNLILKVDKQQVLNSGTVPAGKADRIVSEMQLKTKQQVTKSDMMIMDILKSNNWKRPVYFAVTVDHDMYLGLNDYFQQEGLGYRIIPVKNEGGSVNTKAMYDNMMHKFRWGNIQNPKVYLDENILRLCSTFRMQFSNLAEALILENKRDSALQVLDYAQKVIPGKTVRNDYFSTFIGGAYYELGKNDKADAILNDVAAGSASHLTWYATLPPKNIRRSNDVIGADMAALRNVLFYAHQYNRKKLFDTYYPKFEAFARAFNIQE
jgi:hypothetical protein